MKELERMMCGERLGGGIHRTGYVYALDASKVIKVAIGNAGRASNLLEYAIFANLSATEYARWLAPVFEVSDGGRYLLMARAEFPTHDRYPERLPVFLSDCKYSNYGLFEKRWVCIDYAGLLLGNILPLGKRTRRVEWWEDM